MCQICGGTGFVVPNLMPGDPRFGRAIPCKCKRLELEKKRSDNLVKLSQLGSLQMHTFETFTPSGIGLPPSKAQNLTKAFEVAKAFAHNPRGWLLLHGGYGCGKTHLAAAIANVQLAHGRGVMFVNTPDLLDHLRGTYRRGSAVSYDQRFEEVRNVPMLILDDLGSHNQSDWAQEKLYQIFNYRYNAQLPTVITTNEDIDSMEPRLRSRLSDTPFVNTFAITAPDFRRAGVYHQDSDLSTLHLHSDKTFESFSLRSNELLRGEAENLQRAFDRLYEFGENPRGWIVLMGHAYGNGKTHLAAAAANSIAQRAERVLFVVVPDLLDYLRATFSPGTGARLDKRFHEVKTAPLLILDDLGTESATAWAREKLYQLFNYRYNAQLPTIITTATPSLEALDPRLASRFYSASFCRVFTIEAPTYRGVAKRKALWQK